MNLKRGLMRAVNEDEQQRGAVGGVDEQAHLLQVEPEAVVHDLRQSSIDRDRYVYKPGGKNVTIKTSQECVVLTHSRVPWSY